MSRLVLHWVCVCALVALPVGGCSDETTAAGGSGGTGGLGGDGGTGGMGGMPECESPDDCDDRNECTGSACGAGVCEFPTVANGTACDEDNECSVAMCAEGICPPVADDTACGDDAGTCQQGSCRVACTEQGIRDAITAGGGPYTFACDGPQTVVTEAGIRIDNDVILDGEGNLTVDGNAEHFVFSVAEGVTAELRRVTVVTGGNYTGIFNTGTLTVANSTGSSISNNGTLTLTNSTVSPGNLVNCRGTTAVANSTLHGQVFLEIHKVCSGGTPGGPLTIMGSLLAGGCDESEGRPTSNGYNIESPGDTCGFDQPTDQVNVSADDLKLGPLQDNGGPTMTHALGAGSVAIDVIPQAMCDVDEDQRGFPRDSMCDVGAFEVQP